LQIFTDEDWAIWEPLIQAVQPHGKTPLQNLRQTLSEVFWRHDNGAKWRSIPSELGPWWNAAQTFIRWSKLGVWVSEAQLPCHIDLKAFNGLADALT